MMIVVKVCKFPCSSTTKLLIAAGADPQVIHLIISPPISNHTPPISNHSVIITPSTEVKMNFEGHKMSI